MSRKNWTSDVIFKKILNNKSKKNYWANIQELQARPTPAILKKAILLTKSISKKEIVIGIHILSQLGLNSRPFKNEIIKRCFKLLRKNTKPKILTAILYAIGHNNDSLDSSQISKIASYKKHPKTHVRQALVFALLGAQHKKAINTLIKLMGDESSSIRNWATFGLGSIIEQSNPKIINALWKRVNDSHQETKLEAILGLAIRKEKKIIKTVKRELKNGEFGTLLFKAITELDKKSLLPLLKKIHTSSKKDNTIKKEWIKDLEYCIKNLKGN